MLDGDGDRGCEDEGKFVVWGGVVDGGCSVEEGFIGGCVFGVYGGWDEDRVVGKMIWVDMRLEKLGCIVKCLCVFGMVMWFFCCCGWWCEV